MCKPLSKRRKPGPLVNETPAMKEAVAKYIADGEARNLNTESLKKMRAAAKLLEQTVAVLRAEAEEQREFRNSRISSTREKTVPCG